MRYSMTFLAQDYARLIEHLFVDRRHERCAYILCRTSITDRETRLLVREVIPVTNSEVLSASAREMEIRSISFMRAMKRADRTKQVFVFVHSHPSGFLEHSPQDDREEEKLFATAYIRVASQGPHASLIFSQPDMPRGRVWLEGGRTAPIHCIRVIGDRFVFHHQDAGGPSRTAIFDRQVLAFGADFQRCIARLHIGIVGTGGTGSAVAEQLIRLGVGVLSVFDGQRFDSTNVTRLYGSRLIDDGIQKVKIIERLAADVGLGTEIRLHTRAVTDRIAAEALRDCDVIFCCTDDEAGRAVLSMFAAYYFVPVMDMGVKIDSVAGIINSVQGRVTILTPGSACLFCRGRITADGVRAQAIQEANPEEAEELRKQGYAPELQDHAPAVISLTTAVAATAVTELIHRLTGFMGPERKTSEIIHFFDQTRLRPNHVPATPECFCGDRTRWGRGDVQPFLDSVWPE